TRRTTAMTRSRSSMSFPWKESRRSISAAGMTRRGIASIATRPPRRSRSGTCCAASWRAPISAPRSSSGTRSCRRSRSFAARSGPQRPSCKESLMGLLDLQSALTRLYTDSAFRARFFTDAAEACREIPLTADQQRLLAALDRAQVERFARSLKHKRLGQVRELLPATTHLLGEALASSFFAYCDRQPSALERIEEAVAFIDHLLSVLPGLAPHLHLPGHCRDRPPCDPACS